MECRGWLLGALHTPSSQFLARRPTVNNRRSSTKARPSSSSSSKLFSRSSLGRSCGSQGEERSPWPGVNGVSDKKRGNSRRGMWWFLGGKLSYARMVKIGVHLLQCHTNCSLFCSFNDGGKVLVVEQVQFFWHVHYSVVDWWTSFIFTNHPLCRTSHARSAQCSRPNLIIPILVLPNLFHDPSWTWAQVTPTPYA